jgi:hypothetical protein
MVANVLRNFPNVDPELAQLAQNSGWNTSQVANKGLTGSKKALFALVPRKPLILKQCEAIPGSATSNSS